MDAIRKIEAALADFRRKLAALPHREIEVAQGEYSRYVHQGLMLDLFDNPAAIREVLQALASKDAEIARLTACLSAANSNAEKFEREWYLRGDEIERLREALERISRPHDCGCVPCTGSCQCDEANRITLDAIRDRARAALKQPTEQP